MRFQGSRGVEFLIKYLNQYQELFRLSHDFGVVLDFQMGTYEFLSDLDKWTFESHIDTSCVELDRVYYENRGKLKSERMQVVLICSYVCNMSCIYCYESSTRSGHNSLSIQLSRANIHKIVDFVDGKLKLQSVNAVDFILLGGEPFIEEHVEWYKDFFELFFKKNKQDAFTISCVSNGLCITEFRWFIEKFTLSNVQLTLDGNDEMHNKRRCAISNENSYSRVCEAVDFLLALNVSVSLRINVDFGNYDQLHNIADLIIEKGWDKNEIFSSYVYPVTQGEANGAICYDDEMANFYCILSVLRKMDIDKRIFDLDYHGISFVDAVLAGELFMPKYNFCTSCSNQYVFDQNGIYTCWWGASIGEFSIGWFAERGTEIDAEKLELWHSHSVNNIAECANCKYKYVCGGGCVYKAFQKEGHFYSGNCAEFSALIQVYLLYLFNYSNEHRSIATAYKDLLRAKKKLICEAIEICEFLIIQAEGTSMLPSINNGQEIAVGKYKHDKNNIGKLVLYFRNEHLLLHRIVGKSDGFLVIKGDSESVMDQVLPEDIVGEVVNDFIGSPRDSFELSADCSGHVMKLTVRAGKVLDFVVSRNNTANGG